MSVTQDAELAGVVTTDLAAITRGRFVAANRLESIATTGVGWLPANLSLTAYSTIALPNIWGSQGDLRIVPDLDARYRTSATGASTPFDMVMGSLVELDGMPWLGCTRAILQSAAAALEDATGLTLLASFEHEFQILDAALPAEHALSFAALRRTDPFASRLMAALEEAGVEPEVVIAEFGNDQFEATCAPASAVVAADRAVALRELTREIARNLGWRASFSPKTAVDGVGNGVHVHFSLHDREGRAATYDPARPGRLSQVAGAFCAGVLNHLPALTALTASSTPSFYRLKPNNWSAAYTWLADRNREATLRLCPTTTIAGRDPAPQFNIEYRAADATANPYLALAAIIRAGLAGIAGNLPTPPLPQGDPTAMSESERAELGLLRLPVSLPAALDALVADKTVCRWFAPALVETFLGVRRAELQKTAGLEPQAVCDLYKRLY